jgi:hypothetical protein
MVITAPIFHKTHQLLSGIAYRSITQTCTSDGQKIWKLQAKIHLHPYVIHGVHVTDFDGTHNFTQISQKYAKYRLEFIYAPG